MFTLRLTDGDLSIGNDGFAKATGPDRISQDLRCALLEPLGTDRFHPGYGSMIDSFVGSVLDPGDEFQAHQEVVRVVQNYVAVQRDQLERDGLSGGRSRYSTQDVVASADGITAKVNEDAVTINIPILTANGDVIYVAAEAGRSL